MFDTKKTSLFEVPVKEQGTNNTNGFINHGLKKANETTSANGSLKYASTGNDFVDQFGKLSLFRKPRTFNEISQDSQLLWSINKRVSIMFIFFIRMISRITAIWDGTKTTDPQKGAGNKHEGIMRMIWLHLNSPDSFWKNIRTYISIASWKDIFDMLRYDLEYNGWDNRKLDGGKFGNQVVKHMNGNKLYPNSYIISLILIQFMVGHYSY
jgi:hypothetical protein